MRLPQNTARVELSMIVYCILMVCVFVPTEAQVVISEIHYHPLPLTDAEKQIGLDDDTDFEFLEILNAGDSSVSLNGWRLADAVTFDFPPGKFLQPGERIVIAKDDKVLWRRYQGLSIFGDYSGKLANEGEAILLIDGSGTIRDSVEYASNEPWPQFPNGKGGSLVRTIPIENGRLRSAWMQGRIVHGTPGGEPDVELGPIVINEILAHTDVPFEDAIEIKNVSSQSVNVQGWFLSDSLSELKKFRIPNSSSIPPNDYAVFYEQAFGTAFNPRIPFSLNSFEGDSLYLSEVNQNGDIIKLVDYVEFNATANAIPIGRFPDGTGEFTQLKKQTLGTGVTSFDPPLAINLFRQGSGASNDNALIGPIIVQAFQPSPIPGSPEFIQLKNISDDSVGLWDPLNPSNTWGIDGEINYSFPRGTILGPNESIFLTNSNAESFKSLYKLGAETRVFGPWIGSMNNNSGSLRLYKPDPPQTRPPNIGFVPRIGVDEFTYNSRSPWPEDFVGTGKFLDRLEPVGVALYGDSWRSADSIEISRSTVELSISKVSPTSLELTIKSDRPGVLFLEISNDLIKWEVLDEYTGPIEDVWNITISPQSDRNVFYRAR